MTQPPGPSPDDEALLVEQVASAYRPLGRDELRYHPAWHDLGEAGRLRAYELARAVRKVEAALDGEGMSSTVRAVLKKIG